jgi:hypothetical protein
MVEAAWWARSGSSDSSGGSSSDSHSGSSHLRCVLSSLQQAPGRHSSRPAWVCEAWLCTLDATPGCSLRVVGCQLLAVSRSPPAAAVGCPGSDQLLLVGPPALDAGELPTGGQGARARARVCVCICVCVPATTTPRAHAPQEADVVLHVLPLRPTRTTMHRLRTAAAGRRA